MTVAEGGGKRAVQRKFQDIYVPALKANWLVWPAVQIVNFRVMPIQYQIVCTVVHLILIFADVLLAFCVHRWYCLDSIPLPHELRRRRDCLEHLPHTNSLMDLSSDALDWLRPRTYTSYESPYEPIVFGHPGLAVAVVFRLAYDFVWIALHTWLGDLAFSWHRMVFLLCT